MNLSAFAKSLLGVSTYSVPVENDTTLDDRTVQAIRKAQGGQLSGIPTTRLRWYLTDLEQATREADGGNLKLAAQLCRAMRRDGVLAGLLATRSDGLVRLPKKFDGHEDAVKALQGRDGVRSVFDAMLPATELALMASDGDLLGVAVGELLPVEGRGYPVLVRLDPEYLSYRWAENRWYYISIAGALPITPGDGRWVLYTKGGRVAPWQNGLWHALGRSWINKEHAALHQANWEAKLANPARAAIAPVGATEEQRRGFLRSIIAWGVNTCFELPVGWDVKIIESNGRGYESFAATIERSNREFMIALAGQVVTVDGGAGFSNADIHASIRSDLIKASADALAHMINTQCLPPFVVQRWGEAALLSAPIVEWDTSPPQDQKAAAEALAQLGLAIAQINAAAHAYGIRVDLREMLVKNSIPFQVVDGDEAKDEAGDTPSDRVVEAPVESGTLPTVDDVAESEAA